MSKAAKKKSKVTEMPKRPDNGEAGLPKADPSAGEGAGAGNPAADRNSLFEAMRRRTTKTFEPIPTDRHRTGFLLIPYTDGYASYQQAETGEVAIILKTSQFFDKGFHAKDASAYMHLAGAAVQELAAKGIDFVLGIRKSCEEHSVAALEERFDDMLHDVQRIPKVDANDLRVYQRTAVPATGAGTAA